MRSPTHILLFFSSGGMMISCFYTCTAFVLACLSHHPLSLSTTAGILFLAAIITFCHHRRGWRRIHVYGIHCAGLVFSAMWVCHGYYGVETRFWRLGWAPQFLEADRDAVGWLAFISVLICVWILWVLGRRLSTRPTDPTTISHRFDTGLGYLLGLLIIKLLIAVKGGVVPVAHSSTTAMVAYMVLGLFSMGLVHTKSESQSTGTTYLKGAGIVMSFAAITFMFGGGLFLLFLTELQNLAHTGADLLKTATAPLGPVVVAVLRFIFGGSRYRSLSWTSSGGGVSVTGRPGEELGILHYLFVGMMIAILAAAVGFIFYHLLKWLFEQLFSRTSAENDRKGFREFLSMIVHAIRRVLSAFLVGRFRPAGSSPAAEKIYRCLQGWGRFSGLRHVDSETPREYGMRLTHRFPRIEKEVGLIIRLHDEALYGSVFPEENQLSRARFALRRMRNPSLWLARMKSLCFHDRY